MIKKLLIMGVVIAGLAGYEHFFGDRPTTLPSYAPKTKIEQTAQEPGVFKELVLKYLPAKHTWPEPLRIMYYTVYMEDIVDPLRARADFLPLESIGRDLQHAIIAVEDHDFYQHSAVSLDSIIRAIMINASAQEILQGGSTLTQQLIKNLFLTQEQTLSRKVLEAFLGWVMEYRYSKDEILELYLNSTYFGMECYGANQAAQQLFGKIPNLLKLEEAALIAGLPNAPSVLNPYRNPQAAKERQEIVLETMQKYGFINQNQCWQAKSATIYLKNGSTLKYLDKVAL